MKWIVIVLLFFVTGCEVKGIPEPAIDKIFVSYCHKGIFQRNCSDFQYGVAEVIEKRGIMWRIRLDRNILWIDTEIVNWKPYNDIVKWGEEIDWDSWVSLVTTSR